MNPEDQVRAFQPTADQYAMEFLKNVQNTPKIRFAQKASQSLPAGLPRTAGEVGLGVLEGAVNIPSNLLSGSTKIGEQLGNVITGNPIDMGQGFEGVKELGSSFLHAGGVQGTTYPFTDAAMAKRIHREMGKGTSEGFFKNAAGQLYDPLSGRLAKTADLPEAIIRNTPEVQRIIPINQGGAQIGSVNIGKTFQDYSPKVVKRLLKTHPQYIGS